MIKHRALAAGEGRAHSVRSRYAAGIRLGAALKSVGIGPATARRASNGSLPSLAFCVTVCETLWCWLFCFGE